MAPELLVADHEALVVSYVQDIFSLGCVLYFLAHGQHVMSSDYSTHLLCQLYLSYDSFLTEEIAAVAQKEFRPRINEKCNPNMKGLIKACWAHKPDARPSALEVLEILQSTLVAIDNPKTFKPAFTKLTQNGEKL